MTATNEYEETLILKAEFGGALDEHEAAQVWTYERSPAGRAYRAGVRATRAAIAMPAVSPKSSGAEGPLREEDSARLRVRFEETIREQARGTRKHFLGLVLVSFGAVAFFSTFFGHVLPRFHPKQPGPGDVASLWIIGLGAATAFCVYMGYRLRQLERAPDLFDRLTGRTRALPRTLGQHLRRWPIVVLLIWLVARDEGWLRATVGVVGIWVAFALAAHALRGGERRRRLAEDPELWSWWYGELERGDRPG